MDRAQIEAYTPHRGGMLLLDEIEILGEGKAQGMYQVRGDEFFLQGHFPGNPVVPGVILCEMMAQTCCVLHGEDGAAITPLFTGMKNMKFLRVVRPGETLRFVCQIQRRMSKFIFAEGQGFVGDELCVSGAFSFAITHNGE